MRTLSPPWRRVLIGSWVMIAVLSVVTLVLYVDNKRTRECISGYMVADQKNSETRVELAAQERNLFRKTLVTVVTDQDRADRAKAIQDYIELLNKNDQIRKDNPLLPVPTDCD